MLAKRPVRHVFGHKMAPDDVITRYAGIVLGLAYLRSGALWLPIGIHLAWNLFQDEILNLTADSAHVIAALTTQQGPVWIVGTDYGVELGLAGIFGMGFVFAGIWLWTRKRYVPDPTWEMVN